MDVGGKDPPVDDQTRKELSISLAASSMINASDMINQEAYHANAKRIREVKEMVRRLEMNNEVAHKNFLLDQLEKRVRDGREAEDTMVRLRNQPGLPDLSSPSYFGSPETVQLSNSVPSGRSEVILPTTATLVEVPEAHSHLPYPSSAPTVTSHFPQTIQQGHPVKYQLPPQAAQAQSFQVGVLPYYQQSPTVCQPPSTTPYFHAPTGPVKMGWHTAPSLPPQSRVHDPLAHQTGFQSIQVQPSSQSWVSYPHQVVALPPSDTIAGASNNASLEDLPVANRYGSAPGYYTSSAERVRTAAPFRGGPSTSSSNPTSREPDLSQSTASRPPVTPHGQPQNTPPFFSTFRVQAPLQGVPATTANGPPNQYAPTQSHLKPLESWSQSVSADVLKPVAISTLQQPNEPSQQPQQYEQQLQSHLPRLPQRPPQPQQRSQQSRPQLQRHPQQSQAQLLSQQPPQQPQTYSQVPSQPSDVGRSVSVPQPQNQPSQPLIMQGEAQHRDSQSRADQFTKLFQAAVQGGTSRLKAFWSHAKTIGISDEWFIAAIKSLPPGVWQSLTAQVNQPRATLDPSSSTNTPGQPVSTIPNPNLPVISAPPPLPVTCPAQTVPATQQETARPGTSTEGKTIHSASEPTSEMYTAQLRYYAEQAAKSAFSTQVSMPPANVVTTQTAVATPKRDLLRVQANARTPRDANKSTLARDILRSLGKEMPKSPQGMEGVPTENADDRESDRPPDVTLQSHPSVASPKPPVVPPVTSFADANSRSTPSAKPNAQDELQHIAPPSPLTMKLALKESHGVAARIEGPIMIDLTLEDSDESVDGKEHFPIQTSTSVATSPHPVSPTNTTNHTPMLENLSLEEPPVNTTADGGNADVHMCSPPLSLAAEENMDARLSCAPPGSTEPVSPGFEQLPLPRGASERLSDGQLPLFLPSPPISPVHAEPPETDLEIINNECESELSLKRRSVDVDVMGIDTELVTPLRVRKRRKQQVYVLIPPAPLYVKKAMKKMNEYAMRGSVDSDLEGVEEDDELQYSPLEQLLIEESKSRLLERRCQWLNCGAILNSAASLLVHLKHHAQENSQVPFLCLWANCRKQFGMEQERDTHLERHTIKPLPCPFSGCEEIFDKPVEVMQHEVQHQNADHMEPLIHKPTCQPAVPAIPARLGPPPLRVPSYRVMPRRVVKCRIPADRHAIVGPCVLWNIFSPTELGMRKQNASMRRPTRQLSNYTDSADPRHDDYDFLLALSSHAAKNPQLDDLDSSVITMSAARGLTLWGSGSPVGDIAGSVMRQEDMITLDVDGAVPSTGETAVHGSARVSKENSVPEERRGEEDTVERMLIG